MKNRFFYVWLIVCLVMLSACSHSQGTQEVLSPESDKNNDKGEKISGKKTEQVNDKDVDLRMAKLTARIDELEQLTKRQSQRVFLLEKGLLTGIVPEGYYLPDGVAMRAVSGSDELEDKLAHDLKKKVEEAMIVKPGKQMTPEEEKVYQQKLAEAQSSFNAQQYGRAIALFEKIGVEYPAPITGGFESYWVGISWYYLKNYEAAERSLNQFVKINPRSDHLPKAKLYLAKIDHERGFTESSIKKFQGLMKEYPESEVAHMAREEIKGIEQSF